MAAETVLETIKRSAAVADDWDDVPDCLWLTKHELAEIDVRQLSSNMVVSLRLSRAFGVLPGGLADARLYGGPDDLHVLVEYARVDPALVAPLSLTSTLSVATARLNQAGRPNVRITYLGERPDIETVALEYEVATAGTTLLDHARMGYERAAAIERVIAADLDELYRHFEAIVEPRPLVTMLDVDAVAAARSPYEKGVALEQLIEMLFVSLGGLRLVGRRLRTSTEEVDLIFEVRRSDGPWISRGPLVVIECKNWNHSADAAVVGSVERLIRNRGGQCRLGVLVAWEGVSDKAKQELTRITREPYLIITMDGQGLTNAVQNASFADYFEECYEAAATR